MTRSIVAVLFLFNLNATVMAGEVLQFLGQSTPVAMSDVLTGDQINQLGVNPDDYACFQMDILAPVTGNDMGSGTDCLIFNVIPNRVVKGKGLERGKAFEGLAGDVAVDALSVFSFLNGDVVVTEGKTSLRPLLEGFGEGGTPQRKYITESIPTPGENNALLAPDTREGRAGNVRVSGAFPGKTTAFAIPAYRS